GQRCQHRVRPLPGAALLQAGEVLHGEPGELGDLLPAQARHPPPGTGGQPGIGRRHPVTPGAQAACELTGVDGHLPVVPRGTDARVALPVRHSGGLWCASPPRAQARPYDHAHHTRSADVDHDAGRAVPDGRRRRAGAAHRLTPTAPLPAHRRWDLVFPVRSGRARPDLTANTRSHAHHVSAGGQRHGASRARPGRGRTTVGAGQRPAAAHGRRVEGGHAMGLFRRRAPRPVAGGGREPAVVHEPSPESAMSRLWSDGFGRVATRSLQVLAVLAVIAVFGYVGTRLTLVVVPVLIALVLAAAIFPLVSVLRRTGLPAIVATWIALLALVALLTGIVWLVVLAVVNQWEELQGQALDGIDSLQTYVQRLPFEITDEQVASVRDAAVSFLQSDAVGSGALAGVSQTADFVAGFFIMIVVLCFFLKDGPAMWEFLLRPFEGHR